MEGKVLVVILFVLPFGRIKRFDAVVFVILNPNSGLVVGLRDSLEKLNVYFVVVVVWLPFAEWNLIPDVDIIHFSLNKVSFCCGSFRDHSNIIVFEWIVVVISCFR